MAPADQTVLRGKHPAAGHPPTAFATARPVPPIRFCNRQYRLLQPLFNHPPPSPPPSPQRHVPPPPFTPQDRTNRESPEETGQGGRDTQGEAKGQGRSRSPKTVLSAEGGKGKDKRERIIVVVRSPCQENPADAHIGAHKSVLESANPHMDSECASGCTWSMARTTARLWTADPRSSQTGQVIRGLR